MPGFILDMDGTLYHGKHPIPHAAEFVRHLRDRRLPFLLMTNNSSKTPAQVADHLRETGIAAGEEEIFTSAQAAAQYLSERRKNGRVYAIGETGLLDALRAAGFTLTDEGPDYVVQGIDREFNYGKLAAAVRAILDGARFVMTNPDHLLPSDGLLNPGAGSLGAAIQTASAAEPVVIGKPSPIIMNYALEKLGGLPPQDVWVIGDNIRTDIGGGQAAGCRTALVLTGLATADNVELHIAESGIQPDAVCKDLAEFFLRLTQI